MRPEGRHPPHIAALRPRRTTTPRPWRRRARVWSASALPTIEGSKPRLSRFCPTRHARAGSVLFYGEPRHGGLMHMTTMLRKLDSATLPDAAPTAEDALAEAEYALARIATLDPDDPRRAEVRDRVISLCLPMARKQAARYGHTGEPMEDLMQVATVGLIRAVDRFDGGRGVPFRHFAIPTISGELKRHFRDRCWSIRVGRR